MPMISGEAPFMRLLGVTRCARGLGDFYLSACDRSRDVQVKHFLECEPDITVISTSPIRVSKFNNVRRQLSNEKRRDVAKATAKLLGSTMDIGSIDTEDSTPSKKIKISPVMFSPATDAEFVHLGLIRHVRGSGKECECSSSEHVQGILAPQLPSPSRKRVLTPQKPTTTTKNGDLVQRLREFSTVADVLNAPSKPIPSTPPIKGADQEKTKKKKQYVNMNEARARLLKYGQMRPQPVKNCWTLKRVNEDDDSVCEDSFLIVASDGLYDILKPKDIQKIVSETIRKNQNNPNQLNEAAAALVRRARGEAVKTEIGTHWPHPPAGSHDDVSAFVIRLPPPVLPTQA